MKQKLNTRVAGSLLFLDSVLFLCHGSTRGTKQEIKMFVIEAKLTQLSSKNFSEIKLKL